MCVWLLQIYWNRGINRREFGFKLRLRGGFLSLFLLCLTALLIPPVIKVTNFPLGLTHPHRDVWWGKMRWEGGWNMIWEACRGSRWLSRQNFLVFAPSLIHVITYKYKNIHNNLYKNRGIYDHGDNTVRVFLSSRQLVCWFVLLNCFLNNEWKSVLLVWHLCYRSRS